MRLNKKGRKWDNKRWTNNLDPGSKLKTIWTSDYISNSADESKAPDDDAEEEEVEEDRVDLFVLFSSCRHLPVGHFFASSSSLSATKLGILTIRMITCTTIVGSLQDFKHFDDGVFLIGVTINYEDQNYLYWDGKTGVGWIVKMMISGVKNLTRLMGLKGRHYVLLAL